MYNNNNAAIRTLELFYFENVGIHLHDYYYFLFTIIFFLRKTSSVYRLNVLFHTTIIFLNALIYSENFLYYSQYWRCQTFKSYSL